jgi:flagella basal body P-ring formation protein FlgA
MTVMRLNIPSLTMATMIMPTMITLAMVLGTVKSFGLQVERAVQDSEIPTRAFPSTIIVRSIVQISGDRSEITLADLVSDRGLNPEIINQLQQVRLADAPAQGESRSFTDLGIEQAFQGVLAGLERARGARPLLRIPSRVTVTRKPVRIEASDVENALLRQFRSLCAVCSFSLSQLSLPAVSADVARATVSWRLREAEALPKGAFSVPLEVTLSSGTSRTYWVSGHLSIRREVAVLSRAIAIGERVRPEDVAFQIRDVTFANDAPVDTREFATAVATRSLPSGQIVWRSHLKREMVVKSGDPVKVIAGSEAWQLSLEGVAQGSGYLGDMVRVKIPRTQKIISGVLKEKGVVEVSL